MADRTGIARVDRLIEDFLRTPMGDWINDDAPIEALRDPTLAHGACQDVSDQFAEFAKARGFKAYATNTDLAELGYTPTGKPNGEVLNEKGEIVQGFYCEHTVNTIYPDGDEWKLPIVIDFTASQYGYDEHPKVS